MQESSLRSDTISETPGPLETFDGQDYAAHSDTQLIQARKLLAMVSPRPGSRVLDVGCGNGRVSIELFKREPSVQMVAFDLSETQIEQARHLRALARIPEDSLHFYVADAGQFSSRNSFDLVFSNAALHWMPIGEMLYQRLFDGLKSGGVLAVHQGGKDCYRGLHQVARKAVRKLSLDFCFSNWTYPAFYPSDGEMITLLETLGFCDVVVEGVETDGSEYPDLPGDFARAGLLPYLSQVPGESRNDLLQEFLFLCETDSPDLYSHRLYIHAGKR